MSPCRGGWTNANAPETGTGTTLNGVAVLSSSTSDVWAVGTLENGNRTLAEHWDGQSWSVVPTPDPDPLGGNELFGVAGASADDVWAVGRGGPPNYVLVLHWDGTSWAEVPTPNPGPNGAGQLYDVTVISANDVWAVGIAFGFVEGESYTLTEHWDGTAWSIVPSPSFGSNSLLYRVSADAASDVWAVGPDLVEQWDGSTWTIVTFPDLVGVLSDVAAFGSDDVWATGWDFVGTQPYFEHWDGSAWTDIPGPLIPDYAQIMGIGGPSSARLLAVGTQGQGLLIERWDGTSWHVVSAPSPHGQSPAELEDVAVGSDGVGWTVGTTSFLDGNPIVERTCRH